VEVVLVNIVVSDTDGGRLSRVDALVSDTDGGMLCWVVSATDGGGLFWVDIVVSGTSGSGGSVIHKAKERTQTSLHRTVQ
jgi:hypothetical protein